MSKPVKETAEIFKALGDATRLTIMQLLAAKGNQLCVGIIARMLKISQPAVSQHLKILKNAGLVEADKQGMHMHYKIRKNCLDAYGINTNAFIKALAVEIKTTAGCAVKESKK